VTGAVEAAARAAFDRRLDRTSRAPLAVAVSGGGDSMALLQLAADWAAAAERPLLALTVDHGLHPDSGAWTRFAGEAAARLGLEHRALPWEGPKPATGLPAAARAVRHALLAEALRTAGARVLLVGQTADDLAENVRMRVGGSTLGDPNEWAPSPAWPEGRGVFLLRPLLGCTRKALRDLLRERGERWVEDPANEDVRYARARARLQGSAEQRACFSALPRAAPHPPAPPTPSPARGDATAWGGLALECGETEDAALLGRALLCASGGVEPPGDVNLRALSERLSAGGEGTLAGARAAADGAVVLLGREPGRSGLPRAEVRTGREEVWDGRFAATLQEPGTVGPLAGRAARLSPAERAALRPVPPWVRPTLPVLETASGAVRLLSEARPLAWSRLQAACGVYACEADLPPV